jgi:nucleoside-diphosphate-sugar epimerase
MNAVCEIIEYFLSNHTTADYPIFNVGSGVTYTLLQIAEMIASHCEELFGFFPKIVFSENNISQNFELRYKVDKLAGEMGYVTNNNLESSIDEVLRFCNTEFG